MSAPSPHDPERTAVYGPPSTKSPVDQSPNALARAVDTLSDETPTPQKMMEDVAVCVALLLCSQPSGVLPVGSIRRSISLRAFRLDANLRRCVRPEQVAHLRFVTSVNPTEAG